MKDLGDGFWEADTEDEKNKWEKEWSNLSESEKRQGLIGGTSIGMFKSLQKKDYFKAVEQLGILQYLGDPEAVYYRGLIKKLLKDYSGAIKAYEEVQPTSQYYDSARLQLLEIYEATGNYLLLDKALTDGSLQVSSMSKLEKRLNCLEHLTPDSFAEQKDSIAGLSAEDASLKKENEEDAHAFYQVCRILCDMLVICGECINQCIKHQENIGREITDYEHDTDLLRVTRVYNWCVFILDMSRYLKAIKINEGEFESFAVFALKDKTWPEKIRMFKEPGYIQTVVNIAANICNPDMHKYEKRYVVINNLLDAVTHIGSGYVQTIVDRYYDDILDAAKGGNASAVQYLGFVYADIVTRGKDPHNLKDKISKSLEEISAYDVSNVVEQRELAFTMSRRAHDAYLNAEQVFEATQKEYYGIRDASALALMFFRVIEIEYNKKLILPLAAEADIDKLKSLCGFEKSRRDKDNNEQKLYKTWNWDISQLDDIKNGKRDSLELGTIRVLLVRIFKRYDSCGIELFNSLMNVLTQVGQQAFFNQHLIDVIGKANVESYRNPGAHTGYLPYSVACDAKNYVEGIIPTIETWFKKGSH